MIGFRKIRTMSIKATPLIAYQCKNCSLSMLKIQAEKHYCVKNNEVKK